MSKLTLPAGKYYIGDPSYVFSHKKWCHVINNLDKCNDDIMTFFGAPMFIGSTRYGDGTYFDQDKKEYPVDCGMIGAIPESLLDGEKDPKWNIVNFEFDWEVRYYEGKFDFGEEVVIDTNDLEDEDDVCPHCGR